MGGFSSLENIPTMVVDCDNAGRGVAIDGNSSAPSQTVPMKVRGGLSSLKNIPAMVLDCEEALEGSGSSIREMVV